MLSIPKGSPSYTLDNPDTVSVCPPSFAESQFEVVLRRQRTRHRKNGGFKIHVSPSCFSILSNDFELTAWGTVSYVTLSDEDLRKGARAVKEHEERPIFGPWMASAVAANEVFGSVFYAFPPVAAAAGV